MRRAEKVQLAGGLWAIVFHAEKIAQSERDCDYAIAYMREIEAGRRSALPPDPGRMLPDVRR